MLCGKGEVDDYKNTHKTFSLKVFMNLVLIKIFKNSLEAPSSNTEKSETYNERKNYFPIHW